jgi:nucleoside-diphosphate-sugar epimerase
MILLTGASGFIGKHLLKALIKEYGQINVLALTSRPISSSAYLLHNNYDFNEDYFIKSGVANDITSIIHAGAFIPKSTNEINNWKLCNQNILNTHKLLNSNLPNLKKVIFLSTIDIYGKDDVISEQSPIEPISLYGYSKLYGERMIAAWANSENKICQILRVGHTYGPGEDAFQKIIPATINKLVRNQPVQIWGSGNELRSFIYISDIVKAVLNSHELTANIGPVNIVASKSISISELVNKLISISGKKVVAETLANSMVSRNLVFDNAKMKKYLLTTETTMDDGLQEEWNYMKIKHK